MALLSRLFTYRKNQQQQNSPTAENDRSSCKSFTFNKSQIRVLLFRECDWRGRKLLFDSNAVQKVLLDDSSCKLRFTSRQRTEKSKRDAFVEVTSGCGYQYTKPSTDATLLGEMMFGAVAMTFRGTALKVHALSNPNKLMCTKVFPSPEVAHPNRRISDKSLEDSFGSSINSMSDYYSRSESEQLLESGTLDLPGGEVEGVYSSVGGDSGFCGDFSLQSISSTGSSYWTPLVDSRHNTRQSGGSLSSLQRRWLRNMSTSMELGQSAELLGCSAHHRRTKLGLAVLLTLTEEQHREMEIFIFEHMSIIETMIERLRYAVERAYIRKDMFVHLMYEGWTDLQQSLCDMLCMPRHTCPMWLHLGMNNTETKVRANLAASFVQDLCQLITTLDTKATNFFVSTLLTGVLTHHLGWVNSVATSNATLPSDAHMSLNDLSKSHPYNPLWAQLGDLYGSLGSPTKVAKTIITSNTRKTDCVYKLLTVMTYFIRCGEVKESTNLVCDEITSLVDQALATSREEASSRTEADLVNNSSTVTLQESTLSALSTAQQSTRIQTETWSNDSLKDLETSCELATSSGSSISCIAADKPNVTKLRKTENFEVKLPSFISYLEDGVEPRLSDPEHSFSTLINQRGISTSEQNQGYSHDVCVAIQDKRKNCETEHVKTENKLRVKDGNFCSPAVAEWEKKEHSGILTNIGRESAHQGMKPDKEGEEKVSFSGREECFLVKNREEEIQKIGKQSLPFDGVPSFKIRSPKSVEFDEVDEALQHRSHSNGLGFRNTSVTGLSNQTGSDDWLEAQICHDSSHKTDANGLQSMKRTSSCRKKLSNLSNNSYGLYPNIDELAKMENICLDENYPRGLIVGASEVMEPDNLSAEAINEKVTKLCRVPTSSIMFHLQPSEDEQEFHVQPMERFDSKCVESERQMATCDPFSFRRSKNLSAKSCQGLVEREEDSKVLFVLGDNDELKGIKRRSTSSLVPDTLLNSVDESNTKVKCSSDNNLKANLFSSQSGSSENSTLTLADDSDAKVVTVKASYIDVEVESGMLKTEFDDQSYFKAFETKHLQLPNPIARSSSINLPLLTGKCRQRITKVFRRHTDIFCDKCKTVLKDKRVDRKSNGLSSGSCDEAFVSCEKCNCNNKTHSLATEGLGNFCRTKSEKRGLNLIANTVPDAVTSIPEAALESSAFREEDKTAVNKHEVSCPSSLKHVAKETMETLSFQDMHVVQLPLPRCGGTRGEGVVGLAGSLLGGVSDRYVADLVLQGCSCLPIGWETELKRDLALVARLPLLGQEVAEAVCIVANTNTWEVQLVSSHAYVVDKPGSFGVRVGMSQLVANMLESLVHLWRLKVPPEQCLLHLESKLSELVLRSQALAELLLTTEFCNMDQLTTSLELEANDVPLLLAIASTHSPHIANRYGLSFI